VCHSGWIGSVSGCSSKQPGAVPSDDNVTFGETLTLIFDKAVFITEMVLRDAKHYMLDGDVMINGTVYSAVNGLINLWTLKSDNGGLVSEFVFDYVGSAADGNQFYISSLTVNDDPNDNPPPVPLPAGGLLLLGGLAGLGALKRRRNRPTPT